MQERHAYSRTHTRRDQESRSQREDIRLSERTSFVCLAVSRHRLIGLTITHCACYSIEFTFQTAFYAYSDIPRPPSFWLISTAHGIVLDLSLLDEHLMEGKF